MLNLIEALGGARHGQPGMMQTMQQTALPPMMQRPDRGDYMTALNGGFNRDAFKSAKMDWRQQRHPGQSELPQVPGAQPIPGQQPFTMPQAPLNMVGQSYGVHGMRPGATPFDLPTY